MSSLEVGPQTLPVTTGTMPFRGHETWYRVTGTLDPDAERAPAGRPARRTGRRAQLHAGDDRARRRRPRGRALRPARLRAQHPPARRRPVLLDRRALRRRAARARRAPRHRRPLPPARASPGAGCSARRSSCPTTPASSRCRSATARRPCRCGCRPPTSCATSCPPTSRRRCSPTRRPGTTDSAEYKAAEEVFYDRHVCRVVPNPPEVTASFDQIDADPTVYHAMNGPSEFHVVGSLKEWSVVDRRPGHPRPDAGRRRRVRRGQADRLAAVRRPDPRRAQPRLRRVQPHAPRRGARGLHRGRRRLPPRARLTTPA